MKISILVENTAGTTFKAEHGLSYLIEHKNKTILFDTGHSDLFIENATKLGYNLQNDVDLVVLSHGHWDHGNGLKYFNNKPLLLHPKSFTKRYRKADNTNLGLDTSKEQLSITYQLRTSDKPFLIDPGVLFLGEIPRLKTFEAQTTPFVDENGDPDFVPDDSALVIMDHGALNIITGCSHSGICNIIEYAKKVMHCNTVNAVMGGFHLKHNNEQTKQTVQYFKDNNITHIYPSHCTDLPALAAFYNAFNIEQLKVGRQIIF